MKIDVVMHISLSATFGIILHAARVCSNIRCEYRNRGKPGIIGVISSTGKQLSSKNEEGVNFFRHFLLHHYIKVLKLRPVKTLIVRANPVDKPM